jgi:hypothetical protein
MLLTEVNYDTMRAEDAKEGWICPKCETSVAPKCSKEEVKIDEGNEVTKQVLMG